MLSQPPTKVRLPTTAGEPFTGPPSMRNFQTILPSAPRQYSIEFDAPNSTRSPTKFADEVISESVSNFQTVLPDEASRRKNRPSSVPT